jgi:hypothetical protein
MLEILADERPCRDRPFAHLHRLVVERHHALSGVICVLVVWDEARHALVRHLAALGIPALVLLVAAETDALDDEELRASGVRRLRRGRIAEGLAQL